MLLPVRELQCLEGVFGVHSDDGDGAAGKSFPSSKSFPELLETGLLGACWVRTCLCASGCVSISLRVTGTHGTLADGLGMRILPSQGLMGTQHLLVTSETVTQRSDFLKHFLCFCISLYDYGHTCATAPMWRSKGSFSGVVSLLLPCGSGDQTQVRAVSLVITW